MKNIRLSNPISFKTFEDYLKSNNLSQKRLRIHKKSCENLIYQYENTITKYENDLMIRYSIIKLRELTSEDRKQIRSEMKVKKPCEHGYYLYILKDIINEKQRLKQIIKKKKL